MQRVIECPVCFLIFHPTTRVPKTLSCGHGFCSPCLGNVLKGSTINCPKCRTSCTVPDGKIEKLPTSFAALDTLDTACEECHDQLWVTRCNHCKLNLCSSCLQTHPDVTQSSLTDDLKSLRDELRKLHEKVNNDNVIGQINTQGEATIRQVNKIYEEQIAQIKQQEEEEVTKVREQISKDCEDYLQWKQKFNRNYAEINDFLDHASSKVTMKKVTSDESGQLLRQCHEKYTQLDDLQKTEPNMAQISFQSSKKDFDSLLSKCGRITISSAIDNVTSCGAAVASSSSDQLGPSPDYKSASYKLMIGGEGSGPGQFNFLFGITTSPVTGNIIVADLRNHRIQIFTNNLKFVSMFGSEGDQDGHFKQPFDVAVSTNDKIFITDQYNHRIQVTDNAGRFLYKFGQKGSGKGQFNAPKGLTIDKDGMLYVCDSNNCRVQVLQQDGRTVRCIGSQGSGPCEFSSKLRFIAAFRTGRLVVSDWDGNIYILTTQGQHIQTINARQPPQKLYAEGVAVDRHDNIIITHTCIEVSRDSCIVVLNRTADVITTIGTLGNGPGQLECPTGITVTQEGDILVCDADSNRIQLFTVPKV